MYDPATSRSDPEASWTSEGTSTPQGSRADSNTATRAGWRDRIRHRATSILIAIVALLALVPVIAGAGGGTAAPRSALPGRLEVVLDDHLCAERPCAPLDGELRASSFDATASVSLPADELQRVRPAARELPAGLYVLSWAPRPNQQIDQAQAWSLEKPRTVSVFAGTVTRVRLSRAPAASAHPLGESEWVQ